MFDNSLYLLLQTNNTEEWTNDEWYLKDTIPEETRTHNAMKDKLPTKIQ